MNNFNQLERFSSYNNFYKKAIKHFSLKQRFFDSEDSSLSISQFLNQRSFGNKNCSFSNDYGLNHLISNDLLRENLINLGEVNKILCSSWLNDDFIICGTKCNKLILIDINNNKHYYIPVVESRNVSEEPNAFYSIAINPSNTLLATGTANGFDIAIYRLPTLDILYQLEGGHEDVIFDIVWLDDEFLISGSKDSNFILWKVSNEQEYKNLDTGLYEIQYFKHLEKFCFNKDEMIRQLNFNRKTNDIAVLAGSQINILDSSTMKRKVFCSLQYRTDLVCLTNSELDNLYAVGSKSQIQLLDSRTLINTSTINSKVPECGIRSLSFNSRLLTIGTGIGEILFFDIRNHKYLQNPNNQKLVNLKTSKGWIKQSQDQQQGSSLNQINTLAIYTHKYDNSKTRLFTGGGPLSASTYGNYAALWI